MLLDVQNNSRAENCALARTRRGGVEDMDINKCKQGKREGHGP